MNLVRFALMLSGRPAPFPLFNTSKFLAHAALKMEVPLIVKQQQQQKPMSMGWIQT